VFYVCNDVSYLHTHTHTNADAYIPVHVQVAAKLAQAGISLPVAALSSAGGLHEEIEALRSGRTPLPKDMLAAYQGEAAECRRILVDLISSLLKLPMKPAVYFLAREQLRANWRHWALNIPYYTHFTSPIRRYADICTHRVLTNTLPHVPPPPPATEVRTASAVLCHASAITKMLVH